MRRVIVNMATVRRPDLLVTGGLAADRAAARRVAAVTLVVTGHRSAATRDVEARADAFSQRLRAPRVRVDAVR
jgi:hypothetical protein